MPATTTDSRLAEYYRCRAEYIEDGFSETEAETLAWQMANFDKIQKLRESIEALEAGLDSDSENLDQQSRERRDC